MKVISYGSMPERKDLTKRIELLKQEQKRQDSLGIHENKLTGTAFYQHIVMPPYTSAHEPIDG